MRYESLNPVNGKSTTLRMIAAGRPDAPARGDPGRCALSWRFGRAAAGTKAVSAIVSRRREMRKVLKARIQFPRPLDDRERETAL
jgi:hypothetical protein